MAETPQDVVNRVFREHKRYTGDGLPGEPVNAPLPVGDPQSGPWNPKKKDLREGMLAPLAQAAQSVSDAKDEADRAEQEADRAENAASSFVEIATNFKTVSALQADKTMGYAGSGKVVIVGEGDIVTAQGFRYEVAASDATDAHVETAGGVKLYARPNGRGFIALEQLGAVGDGATDNGDIFESIGTIFEDYEGAFTLGEGTFKTNKSLVLPKRASLIGLGRSQTIIDAYASTGTFTESSVVSKVGGIPVAMPALAGNLATGDRTIAFASAHALSVGDVFLIYNDTDYSYSPFRPVYRQGEYVRVRAVVNTTTITAERGIYSDGEWSGVTDSGVDGIGTGGTFSPVAYAASTAKCYRIDEFGTGVVEGISVIAPTTGANIGVRAIFARYMNGFRLNDVNGQGGQSATIAIFNSFDIGGRDIAARNQTPASGNNYALSIANCQKGVFSHLDLDSTRHTVTLGGAVDYAIPCRDIHIGHGVLTSHGGAGVSNADWHGNVEWCSYHNLSLFGGGLNIAGNHNRASDIQIDSDGAIIYGREMSGLDHQFTGIQARTSYANNLVGPIDIGGTAEPMTANTALGGTLKFSNMKIEAPNNIHAGINIRNRGFAGVWSVKVSDIDYTSDSAGANGAVARSFTVSGAAPVRFDVANIRSRSASVADVTLGASDTAVKVSGLRETGSAGGTTSASAAFLTVAVTFAKAFPKVPSVQVNSLNSTTNGTDLIDAIAVSVTTTGFTLRFRRIDQVANFAAALAVSATWTASLGE